MITPEEQIDRDWSLFNATWKDLFTLKPTENQANGIVYHTYEIGGVRMVPEGEYHFVLGRLAAEQRELPKPVGLLPHEKILLFVMYSIALVGVTGLLVSKLCQHI